MNCNDETPTLKGLSLSEKIRILAKERNDFAKSRKAWIQCAFDLYHGNGKQLFYKMISDELCGECINKYHDETT